MDALMKVLENDVCLWEISKWETVVQAGVRSQGQLGRVL